MITAIPYQVNNEDILAPINTANSLMNYYQCGYMNGKLMSAFAGYCSNHIKPTVSKASQFFTIKFKKLAWVFSATNTNFKISASPPLSYMRVQFNATDPIIRYAAQTYSVSTNLITVTNVPTSINILSTIPGLIFVGDTIQVEVSCVISSGSFVPKIKILASIVNVVASAENMLESDLQKMLVIVATGSNVFILN